MKRPTSDIPAEVIRVDQILVESKVTGVKKEIDALAKDMEENGLVYPIVVATGASPGPAPEGQTNGKKEKEVYRLKAGYKRLAAAKLLGGDWREIKAVVIPPLVETLALEDRFAKLIEQLQRKELSDFDIAHAAVDMETKHQIKGTEFAKVMGISQGYTYNLMRWYKTAPTEIRTAWKEDHPLLNQSELENMTKLQRPEALAYWEKRVRMHHAPEPFLPGKNRGKTQSDRKTRRPTETQMMRLQEAVDASALIDPVKELVSHVIKFSLGVMKNVPGITDYRKLDTTIIQEEKETAKRSSKEAAA